MAVCFQQPSRMCQKRNCSVVPEEQQGTDMGRHVQKGHGIFLGGRCKAAEGVSEAIWKNVVAEVCG